MHFIPEGTISLPDLVEMVVAQLYGQDAIAEIDKIENGEVTSFQLDGETLQQRSMYVIRAGVKIPYIEDGQRWDGVTEQIRLALSSGKLTAYVDTKSNQEQPIPKSYWMDEVPASLTVYSGAFRSSPKPEFEDCSVYVGQKVAVDWIAALNPPEESSASKDKRGRPSTKDYEAFEETLKRHAVRLGSAWIALKTNAELAEQTRKWMNADLDISNDVIPGQRMAETRISAMRVEGRIPPKE